MNLQQLVEKWLEQDPNPKTRAEIQDLWDRQCLDDLQSRLGKRIEFGTAGLRGRMEAGWARMNDLIIIQASQGLAEYVLVNIADARTRGLVIGHDHRHHSKEWAHLTAKVFITKGINVYLLQGFNHTPLVPFSVKHLNAACGVMITASHNPKQDNGYKVYWENAVQIIAPHDAGISAAIMNNLEPQPLLCDDLTSSALCSMPTQKMQDAYFNTLSQLSFPLGKQSNIHFVNTSMHGVSDPLIQKVFKMLGYAYIAVQEQQVPDPDFPTVSFPNPEEKGALDIALAKANAVGATYILAQDPDADRFAAAERQSNGDWHIFTGDQLGVLFADQALQQFRTTGEHISKFAVVASTVSSKMVETMAAIEGFKFVECLTGFKFIGNTALKLVSQGFHVPFGYEEAIGYMFGPYIRDKDGVAATLAFASLVTHLHDNGESVFQHLQTLYKRYGFFRTKNGYFTCYDAHNIKEIFHHLQNYKQPKSYPTSLGSFQITRVVDLTLGYDSGNPPTYASQLPVSSGFMLQFRAANADSKISLTLRTSGTEPKIKFYLEGSGKDVAQVDSQLVGVLEDMTSNWIQAVKYGLQITL